MSFFGGGAGPSSFFGGPGPGFGFPGQTNNVFRQQYRCFSIAMYKSDLEKGDKIVLPQSALIKLGQLNIQYPMLFQITNGRVIPTRQTHCGVMEFGAPEGKCFLPHWMMQNLLLEEGHIVNIQSTKLPKCTFVKLRPASFDFLKLSNPRVTLENCLRSFSCVTKGDQLCISYNKKQYFLEVRDVKPANAASIIETDVNVDFEAPAGYEEAMEKERKKKEEMEANKKIEEQSSSTSSEPLPIPSSTSSSTKSWGGGQRLDGNKEKEKKRKLDTRSPPNRIFSNKGT